MLVAAQTRAEAEWLIRQMREHDFGGSILEVGSHMGGFLAFMAYNCDPKTAKIRSVDLTTLYGLGGTIKNLKEDGYDAEVYKGNSTSADAVAWAKENGPYDFVFIDGDHTYDGVLADWRNYGPLGRWVGFHDIKEADHGYGTVQLWEELKDKYPSMEIGVAGNWNGIGLLKMPSPAKPYIHQNIGKVSFALREGGTN